MARLIALACYTLLLAGLFFGPVKADVFTSTRAALTELEAARAALAQKSEGRPRIVAMTRAIHAFDLALLSMRAGLNELDLAANQAQARFESRKARMNRLLGSMTAVSRAPAALEFIHPQGPEGAARAGIAMRALLPKLRAEAAAFQADASRLAALADLQRDAIVRMRAAGGDLRKARSELKIALFQKQPGHQVVRDDAVQLARLARGAQDLQDLIDGLALLTVAPPPADAPDMDLIKGRLPWPAAGRILRGYREMDQGGIRRPGVIMGTAPLTLVTTPFSARVRYTGRFLDHGLVVMLEPQPGYLLVLSGLSQVSVVAGQSVTSGRPVGMMGGKIPKNDDFLIEMTDPETGQTEETLYIELRHDGRAQNPLSWFRDADHL